MSDTDLELLKRYTRDRAEDAFAEIVRRHLDLVHSAALRQVRSPQLAEEVAQSTFTDLARTAHRLAPDTILTAWLYQVTRRTAIDVVRREARRQLREQIATEMNAMNAITADWTHIEPLLDEAMHALDDTDRAAVLLRYFENKSLREVGATLGTSDDAAQKRVSRAIEHLREFFAKRGVTVGASVLVVVMSANAVQAAPVGLAVTISIAAVLTGTAASTSTVIAATKTIVMTTLQKTVITATVAVLAGTGIYEARQASQLRNQVQTLQQQQVPLAAQIQQLQRERDEATNQLVDLTNAIEKMKSNSLELLKLRGEVTQLKVADGQKKNDPIESTAATWAAKAKQVKQWLEQTPTESIPELQLLSESDLLHTVSSINHWQGTNDLNFASSVLRTRAKTIFVQSAATALGDYLIANNGQLPNDILELKAFFTHPDQITGEMLSRYKLLHAGNTSELPSNEPLISETTTSQAGQYDSLFTFGAFDWSSRRVVPLGADHSGETNPRNPDALKKLFKLP